VRSLTLSTPPHIHSLSSSMSICRSSAQSGHHFVRTSSSPSTLTPKVQLGQRQSGLCRGANSRSMYCSTVSPASGPRFRNLSLDAEPKLSCQRPVIANRVLCHCVLLNYFFHHDALAWPAGAVTLGAVVLSKEWGDLFPTLLWVVPPRQEFLTLPLGAWLTHDLGCELA